MDWGPRGAVASRSVRNAGFRNPRSLPPKTAPMTEPPAATDRLQQALETRFGLSAFRPWQREAIDALVDGPRRVLVVAPTGGGKSLTYQLPAVVLEGTTVVVSPLIALMEDQVRGLRERGIEATFLASTLSRAEVSERERELLSGKYDLVYVAPERLGNPWLVDLLRRLKPPLVAIDEAHCISQWGHDFRPDYLRLGELVRNLAPEHVLACTATATPLVRDEILERLGLQEAEVVLRGFARPNLHLEAATIDSKRARMKTLKDALADAIGDPGEPAQGAAIVYAATRKESEKVAGELAEMGYDCAAYHAGLASDERAKVNAAFGGGELDVVAATNAFGMGIDRPDIRLVVHAQAPGSIEAYYQEVGRAGRDGLPAKGLLLSASKDLALRRFLIESGTASEEHVERQWSLFLDLMRYVEAGSCRHDFILRYFGDEEEILGGCGHCDLCARMDGAEATVTEEDVELVRKALAGIARTKGRVGMRSIADMLAGRGGEKLARWGFDRLSTYGILQGESAEWLGALIRRLITAGYATISGDRYPLVGMTRLGWKVMKGDKPVRVIAPDRKEVARRSGKKRGRGKGTSLERPGGAEGELFEALREKRRELAKEHGVPAYVVCSDRTLLEIASTAPGDAAALEGVHGMGPAKVARFGDALLEVVAAR